MSDDLDESAFMEALGAAPRGERFQMRFRWIVVPPRLVSRARKVFKKAERIRARNRAERLRRMWR